MVAAWCCSPEQNLLGAKSELIYETAALLLALDWLARFKRTGNGCRCGRAVQWENFTLDIFHAVQSARKKLDGPRHDPLPPAADRLHRTKKSYHDFTSRPNGVHQAATPVLRVHQIATRTSPKTNLAALC